MLSSDGNRNQMSGNGRESRCASNGGEDPSRILGTADEGQPTGGVSGYRAEWGQLEPGR